MLGIPLKLVMNWDANGGINSHMKSQRWLPWDSPPWGSPRHMSAPAHLSTVCEAAVASVGKKTSEAQPMAVQNPGMFPKMVVAQNHPNLDHFSTETHGLGDPPF